MRGQDGAEKSGIWRFSSFKFVSIVCQISINGRSRGCAQKFAAHRTIKIGGWAKKLAANLGRLPITLNPKP